MFVVDRSQSSEGGDVDYKVDLGSSKLFELDDVSVDVSHLDIEETFRDFGLDFLGSRFDNNFFNDSAH